MASSKQDKIEQLANDQADAIDAKNQALRAKFVDFVRSAQDKSDSLHEGMQQRISSWVSEIDS